MHGWRLALSCRRAKTPAGSLRYEIALPAQGRSISTRKLAEKKARANRFDSRGPWLN
jgi:hypothetical protein